MKVCLKGQSRVLEAVEITAENHDHFNDSGVKRPIGFWIVYDKDGMITYCGPRVHIERYYEHPPQHYSTRPGWMDRPPEEMQKR